MQLFSVFLSAVEISFCLHISGQQIFIHSKIHTGLKMETICKLKYCTLNVQVHFIHQLEECLVISHLIYGEIDIGIYITEHTAICIAKHLFAELAFFITNKTK